MKKTHIMVHHSLTKDSGTVSWAAIEKFHRDDNDWLDIGYHKGIEIITDLPHLAPYRYQSIDGRPDRADASACPQGKMNRVALHVCCVGNFDLAPPPSALIDRLLERVIVPWMVEYDIPATRIVGHRDYNPAKSCPGRLFNLDALRAMVR